MEVILPKWGMTMKEATIMRWLHEVDDFVEAGAPLVDVETDKVDAAVEAPVSGQLIKCCVAVGDVVPVGATIAVLETPA